MDFQDAPVSTKRDGDTWQIAVSGSVHTNVAWLEDELNRVVAAKPKKVELDLAKTSYVSSVGVGVIVAFYQKVVEAGGAFRVVAIQKKVHGIFKFARLDTLLQIDPSVIK